LTFGYLIDLTGNWNLPFIGSMGLLLVGALLSVSMHPEETFHDEVADLRLQTASAR
jgi:hypothetical protein